MNQLKEITEKLEKRIQSIIESDSGEELHLLPELIDSLINLVHLSSSLED